MIQFLIAVTGVLSIVLATSASLAARRAGCVVGLAGQPFWVYTAITHQQDGILFLALVYTVVWACRLRQLKE